MMRTARLLVILAVAIIACAAPPTAGAQGVGPDANGGGATVDNEAKAKEQEKKKKDEDFGDKCRPGVPGINEIADAACDVVKTGQEQVTGAPGKIAGKVVGGALDQATEWMTDAAVWTTKQIAAGIKKTATPELEAGWYRERFAEMVALGMGLAALVTLMALVSAAIRRDPEALGATVYGMLRAGLGTGLVLVLTVLALGIADQISNAFVSDTAGGFWRDVGEAWGADNFAGFGSSAIAFLFALIQVLAGLAVWIEMLLRSAAIYLVVLFLPLGLAASIWPALREWETRMVKVLAVLVMLKPVIMVALSLAGSMAAAAVTGEARGDIGVLLAAIVIFALAALSPWALMAMVSMSAEGAWSARVAHHGAREGLGSGASAVGGSLGNARSVASRMRGIRRPATGGGGGGSGGSSGGSGGGGGLRPGGGGGGGKTVGPGPAGGGGGGGSDAAPGGTGAKAGPVGTIAAAAGLGAYAPDKQAGHSAAGAAGGGSGGARRGAAQPGRTPSRPAPNSNPSGGAGGEGAGGGRSRPAAPGPRTGQRPGGGRQRPAGGRPGGERA
jgi:hypothetical protein